MHQEFHDLPKPSGYPCALPLVTVIFTVFGHWLNLLPTLLSTLIFTAVLVTLMTYAVMPRKTRLFSFWLYPDRK